MRAQYSRTSLTSQWSASVDSTDSAADDRVGVARGVQHPGADRRLVEPQPQQRIVELAAAAQSTNAAAPAIEIRARRWLCGGRRARS